MPKSGPLRLGTWLLLGVFFALGGCYHKDFEEPGTRSLESFNTNRNFGSNFNLTWNAVMQALKDTPILVARKESGYVVSDWIIGKSDLLYSGYDQTRIPYKIRYKMFVRVRPYKGGTSVLVRNQEQYFTDSVTEGGDFTGSLYKWVDTKSSTHREKEFLDDVEKLLPTNQR